MRFEFATAGRIVFGAGALREAGPIAKSLGRRALIVTGRNADRAGALLSLLGEQGISHIAFAVSGEPAIQTLLSGRQRAKETGCDLVIGFGGGSAIDAGKAIAALAANEGDVFDYLEVIGRGKPI